MLTAEPGSVLELGSVLEPSRHTLIAVSKLAFPRRGRQGTNNPNAICCLLLSLEEHCVFKSKILRETLCEQKTRTSHPGWERRVNPNSVPRRVLQRPWPPNRESGTDRPRARNSRMTLA